MQNCEKETQTRQRVKNKTATHIQITISSRNFLDYSAAAGRSKFRVSPPAIWSWLRSAAIVSRPRTAAGITYSPASLQVLCFLHHRTVVTARASSPGLGWMSFCCFCTFFCKMQFCSLPFRFLHLSTTSRSGRKVPFFQLFTVDFFWPNGTKDGFYAIQCGEVGVEYASR